jgi:mono/diheme cytochrome c family protein
MTRTPPPRPSTPWRSFLCLAVCFAGVAAFAAPPPEPKLPPDHAERLAKGKDLFTKSVRAILIEQCVKCHGGDKTQGGLDLRTRELLLKGGQHGAAVVPFDSKESRLFALVNHDQPPHMPSKAPKLPAEQIAQIAAWIDNGAPYDKPLLDGATVAKKPMVVTDEDRRFWSFVPLKRPAVPAPKDDKWCRTPIDRFILAKLDEKGLTPNPVAERRVLIRRAYFDLIGLPPTPEEIEAFVNDRSPDAWEKVIDRLLASPHYGERWGRHWLDLARFAESNGYEHDYDRPSAYHYRDFVIKALNADLPYDTFVKWQIAGDEMEPDNPLALTATGFLGAGVHSTQITKNQVEKERYDELDDIVRTTGTAMLGLTIGCARCHDHKFDPIPTRDYYRLLSTFTTTVRTEIDLNLDPAVYAKARAAWEKEHATVTEPLRAYEKDQLAKQFEQWLANRPKDFAPPKWAILDLSNSTSKGGATLTKQGDGSILVGGKNPDKETLAFTAQTQARGITAIRLEALADPSLVKGGPGRATNGNFALSDIRLSIAPQSDPKKTTPVKFVAAKATFEQQGLPVKAAIDNDKTSAWAVDPQFGKNHAAVFDLESPVGFDGGTVLTFTLEFNNNKGHGIGRPRLSLTTAELPAALDGDAASENVLAVLTKLAAPDAALTPEERQLIVPWFRTTDAKWRELNQKVEEHARSAPKPQTVKAMICSEGLPAIRLHTQGGDFLDETHFLKRGDPNQKDGVATQSFLQVLMRTPEQEKHWQVVPPPKWRTSYRRTSLANWITDTETGAGSLLARVIVNRLWQHHMGAGLVATPSDFGFQGERPTHPELLDWLARELIDNGWRLKPLHKQIMTSAVYMQGTQHDKARAKLDDENRYYWRRVPRRLEAEIIRDSLLAVSGTLDTKQFGPGTLDPTMKRRSIYFFVKRSQLNPTMVLFDGPDTLQGAEQRGTTTIAPQALLLMNNPVVRGCAESMAKRVAADGKTPADTVANAYMVALGRKPNERELTNSVTFLKEQTAAYEKDGKMNAAHLALADFCQVLMGLNEFVYVD